MTTFVSLISLALSRAMCLCLFILFSAKTLRNFRLKKTEFAQSSKKRYWERWAYKMCHLSYET